jgi:hypothetical protein
VQGQCQPNHLPQGTVCGRRRPASVMRPTAATAAVSASHERPPTMPRVTMVSFARRAIVAGRAVALLAPRRPAELASATRRPIAAGRGTAKAAEPMPTAPPASAASPITTGMGSATPTQAYVATTDRDSSTGGAIAATSRAMPSRRRSTRARPRPLSTHRPSAQTYGASTTTAAIRRSPTALR